MPHLVLGTSSEDETIAFGVALGRALRPGDLLGLDGELGAGKTRLVWGIAEGMGLDPAQVSSPTYVLMHEYRNAHAPGTNLQTPLYHVDAYRLTGPDDLDSLGWDLVINTFGVVVVEWAQRVAAALESEPSYGRVRIQHEPEGRRRIDVIGPGAWAQRAEWRAVAALATPDVPGRPAGWARCPVTGAAVSPETPSFPFANDRVRMADLGRWLTGQYLVSRKISEDDAGGDDAG